MADSDKYDFINRALDQRRENHRFRSLRALDPSHGNGAFVETDTGHWINFSSNDYLGLSGHVRLKEQSHAEIKEYGTGSTASRLICGTYSIHQQLERQLAETFEREAALVFNTGFQANSSIIATLTNRNSLILADKRSHNSLLQGALLSRAKFRRFAHNDLADLAKQLEKADEEGFNRIFIITESVFSMDGDRPELDHMTEMARSYGAFLFVDEAHAVGVWGDRGRGLTFHNPDVDLVLGTFGKAFGSFGSFVLCSSRLKDYLINFCPGFIYTTALPPAVIGANQAALEVGMQLNEERDKLHRNTEYLRNELTAHNFDIGTSTSQIIPVIIGAEEQTLDLQRYLENEDILATAIRPPTVEKGKSRVRITLSSRHEKKHLNKFLQLLYEWQQKKY